MPEHADETLAWVATFGIITTCLALLGYAAREALRGRNLALGCMVGGMVLGFGEPVFDSAYTVSFYAEDMTIWSPFGISQPIWVPFAYGLAFGPTGFLIARFISEGMVSRRKVLNLLLAAWIGYWVFEVSAYYLGVMQYDEHRLAVMGTPFWHQVLFAVFIVVAGIAIGAAQPLLRNAGAVTNIGFTTVVYTIGFSGVVLGAGFPALCAMHTSLGLGWLWAGAVISAMLGLIVFGSAIDLLGVLPKYREKLAGGPRVLRFVTAPADHLAPAGVVTETRDDAELRS